MQYPVLLPGSRSRQTVDVFGGYNHNLRIGDGEFYDMKNLTADRYPVLAPRGRRGVYAEAAGAGGMVAKDCLCYTDGTDFVMNGYRVNLHLEQGEKQLISMGAYVIIMPDKKWINTLELTDHGSVEASFTTATDVTFTLCALDGTPYPQLAVSQKAPEDPEDGALWIDTSAEPHSLKQYAAVSGLWVSIAATYVKIAAVGIGRAFRQYDGVELSGILPSQLQELNGPAVIWERGDDFLVVPGLLTEAVTQAYIAGPVTVERKMPEMDFVTECGNRLWGCRYGMGADGQPVNALYACKLGDFRNWSCFMGLSTDSWTAAVGTDGPFTGAVTHLGHPVFFKEHCLHKVYISPAGAHQVQDTACRGVQAGSGRSLAIVGETLLYQSESGICAYDGSLPVRISDPLGNTVYTHGVGGALGSKYYISMQDLGGNRQLFVYDTAKGLWHKEDDLPAAEFCACRGELYAIDREKGRIVTMLGSGQQEQEPVAWMAQTGELGLSNPDRTYVCRIQLQMALALGARVDIFAQYDLSEEWIRLCSLRGTGLGMLTVPIRPRRCGYMKLRLEGVGEARLYAITRTVEEGSDSV